eukprot:356673-Chlamydomonas_euryale.AAC.4
MPHARDVAAPSTHGDARHHACPLTYHHPHLCNAIVLAQPPSRTCPLAASLHAHVPEAKLLAPHHPTHSTPLDPHLCYVVAHERQHTQVQRRWQAVVGMTSLLHTVPPIQDPWIHTSAMSLHMSASTRRCSAAGRRSCSGRDRSRSVTWCGASVGCGGMGEGEAWEESQGSVLILRLVQRAGRLALGDLCGASVEAPPPVHPSWTQDF